MLPHDILYNWFCIRAFFALKLSPRTISAEIISFRIKRLFCFGGFFPNLKLYLLHFFALIMTFPLWFPKQTAGWTRIALICSTRFEQQISKMWIEKGNTKHAFDLQSKILRIQFYRLRILSVDKSVCSVHEIHRCLRPEETIRTNWLCSTEKIKDPIVSASSPHPQFRPNNTF